MTNWTQAYLIIATLVQTGVLIWGLKKISSVLETPVVPAAGANPGATFARSMLSEKNPAPPPAAVVGGAAAAPAAPAVGDASFSRVAGSIGTIVLAAFIAGVSYWALFSLFNGNDLSKIQQLGTFLLAASALFAPYAFNQLSSIFK